MNKIAYCICFILLLQACCIVNKSKMANDYVDITQYVPVEDFKTIAAVILKKGDRRFYCNMYNNSPHYKVDDAIDLYLDPIDHSTNIRPDRNSSKVSDYNTLVIQDNSGDGCTKYYNIMLHHNAVVLKGNDDRENGALLLSNLLNRYVPLLKKTITLN